MTILNWYPATSADLEHDDLETDLGTEAGEPGGAVWAWVADEATGGPWSYTVYARWLWEDIDADPGRNILAEGTRDTQGAATTAVEAWVMAQDTRPSQDQEN
jgi:hypothetical protein